MAKHLIDLDEPALERARAELGTSTIKDTVNEALRRASNSRKAHATRAMKVLASLPLEDRAAAWR